MNRLKLYCVLLLMIASVGLSAQQLSGKVLDQSSNPISDAVIYLNSYKSHSHSDLLGSFTLNDAQVGDTLRVSYLGYETLESIVTEEDFQKELRLVLKEQFFDLEQVQVSNSRNAINQVAAIDLQLNPVRSAQEVLQRVPGLIIAQHAGGGKAEQIFLRGFDIDHGTDIKISVDGMPVNMVSHAHGQGYSDLHFLIPETIETIDFGKGPYYADQGNFGTAGYVNFKTKDRLESSQISMEYGQFNTIRTLGLFDLLGQKEKQDAYLAVEYLLTDGPVESPQNFNRLNVMGKYNHYFENDDRLSILVSRFQSRWDASGQIPQRLVDSGEISRFGFVDNTEGGNTSRTNVLLEHTRTLSNRSFLKTNAFYTTYDFELYSNFTFFLEDPVNGDQIRQRENRNIFGFQSQLFQNYNIGNTAVELNAGLGLRYDDVDENELSRSLNRRITLEQIAFGDVDESNLEAFAQANFDFGKWQIIPGLRVDAFVFSYENQNSALYESQLKRSIIASPKLNISFRPELNWQIYLKSGFGFHSNDSRVVVARAVRETLPAAFGVDLGTVWKPLRRLWLNAALWHLYLEQEFVYVGDAGIVEPSGETRRQGVEFGFRYQIGRNFFLNSDINYNSARAINEPEGNDYIPLAPTLTAAGGLALKLENGFNAGLRYRYVKDRPANEDNTIIAEGYFITDLTANYSFKNFTVGIIIENLFDQEWNEAQFATESRLANELEPVEEIHFTPGVPFFMKMNVAYRF